MNSLLNPEAPEFHPLLKSVTQETHKQLDQHPNKKHDGYKSAFKSIRSSNALPARESYGLFKTFTDFNTVTCHLSENVIQQSSVVIVTELPTVKLNRNDHELNMEKLIDANDSFLDRICVNIDTCSGVNAPGNQLQPHISSWNTTPVIAKKQMGSTTFIGAKNVPRPQLNFKDTIDNSYNLWVPKISDKPNNIKPLALNILYNDEGEAIGYEHPYKVELDLYHPPAHLFEPDTEEVPFPEPLENTKFTYIDTEEKLDELVEHLNTVSELAVDLEHHSYRTYQGITCLIQISTDEGGDFIIDALAVREHLHKLNLAFTNPKKLKVFHGALCDVIWLQRDFGVYLVGMFDTHEAAKVLNLPALSLKYLLMQYCHIDVDKKYQLADWRMRPLPDELVQYARMDTHYLLYIWRQMRNELLNKSASQPQLLLSVFKESVHVCSITYNKEVITDMSHMPLYIRSKKSFNSQQLAALKMLYKWRDTQARELDESTKYLIPNHMLLSLAESLPREMQGVNAICYPMPPFIKQNLITIHRMLLSCRELPNEPQLYQMPTTIRSMVNAFQTRTHSVHDFNPEISEEHFIYMEKAVALYEQYLQCLANPPDACPQIAATSEHILTYTTICSDLNAEAKQFVPPFDRYRKYRSLAQIEEIKEFKDKEAKIAAIGKGNELIKAEVLVKLQQAKTQIQNEEKKNDCTQMKKTQQRKRKISAEKVDIKQSVDSSTEFKKEPVESNSQKNDSSNVKSFSYRNANYNKFFTHSSSIKQSRSSNNRK